MTGPEPPSSQPLAPGVRAEAVEQAQQAVLGQGAQYNYFGTAAQDSRAAVVLDTLMPPPVLVGRSVELRRLRRARRQAQDAGRPVVISAVHGMGGAGKTALARALAAEVAEHFPDGRFEVDLRGFSPGHQPRDPGDVLGELLALVGFAPAGIPSDTHAKGGLWRGWLANRRVLLILDNARDAAQVEALLPGAQTSGGCLVVVTSRDRLIELDVAARLGVDTLPAADAVALLVGVAARSQREVAASEGELAELAELCGCLPLALRPVGSLLAVLGAAEVIEVMRSAERPLQHLEDVDQVVQAAFAVSFQALPSALRQALRLCAWHPGPNFDAGSLAALAGEARPLAAVRLARLLGRNMVIDLPQGRYTFHDLFLGYARQYTDYADGDPAVRLGRRRLYGHLSDAVCSATAALTKQSTSKVVDDQFGTPSEARAWLTAASGELTTAAYTALKESWEHANAFAGHVAFWLFLDEKHEQSARLYTMSHMAALDAGDLRGQADALTGLGNIARVRDNLDQADAYLRSAFQLRHDLKDRLGQAQILVLMGFIAAIRNDLGQAQECYERAFGYYADAGDELGQADTLLALGRAAKTQGDLDKAHECNQEAFGHYQHVADRLGQAHTLIAMGDVAQERNDFDNAYTYYDMALQLHKTLADRRGQADALRGLGDVTREWDGQARAYYQKALRLRKELEDRRGQAQTHIKMAELAVSEEKADEARWNYQRAAHLFREIGLNRSADHCVRACDNIVHPEEGA